MLKEEEEKDNNNNNNNNIEEFPSNEEKEKEGGKKKERIEIDRKIKEEGWGGNSRGKGVKGKIKIEKGEILE